MARAILNNAFVPAHYQLTLEPDLDKFTFDGTVVISGDVKEPTTKIVLHSRELSIPASASYTSSASPKKTIKATQVNFNLAETTVELVFGESIPAGEGSLTVPYVGQLNNQMAGFYRSSYPDIYGNKKIMASTQFEPLDARRALPCVDEPAVKATFGVTMVVPAALTAFSNMPEKESRLLPNGKKRIEFLDSPKMSTYLLAFCVGEFDFLQTRTDHGVMIRVYTPPGKAHEGSFGLECGKRALDFFDDFFGIPYPLPKLDMVAIPEFAMGAMENWGLVTYRDSALLVDPAKATPQQRQRVCTVVAHELAHQWFGNLVTMAWWSDLWLNEGFATFMQNLASDLQFPEWELWEQFGTDILVQALGLDSLRSSHPIQVPIRRAEDVSQVFDAISYRKGASVIRMIYSILGHDTFRAGLRLYMNKHQYGNTETQDLWSAWAEASGLPIGDLMASWTLQMGFPVLVVKSESHADGVLSLEVEQRWFLADGSEGDGRLWTVPLKVATAQDPKGEARKAEFFSTKTFTVTVPMAAESLGFVKLNAGQTVPLRVAYTPAQWDRLAAGVRDKTLVPADRVGTLLDLHALVRAGLADPEILVRFLAAFRGEDSATVWTALGQVLESLGTIMRSLPQLSAHFAAFAMKLVGPQMAVVGWDATANDKHLGKMKRTTLISLVSQFSRDDPVHVAEVKKRVLALHANVDDALACPTEYRTSALQMFLRWGGEQEYEQVMDLYKCVRTDAEKRQIMVSLGFTSLPHLKLRTLNWATSGAVKTQDFFYVIRSVSSSSQEGLELTWQYFQDNFARIHAMVATAPSSLMVAAIAASCDAFATDARADEIAAFFATHPLPECDMKITQLVETVRVAARFARRIEASTALADDTFWMQ